MVALPLAKIHVEMFSTHQRAPIFFVFVPTFRRRSGLDSENEMSGHSGKKMPLTDDLAVGTGDSKPYAFTLVDPSWPDLPDLPVSSRVS